MDSNVLPPPFIGEYSPPATDGVISDGGSSGEDVNSTSTSPSSTRSQSSNSSTDRSDTSNEQALLMGNDGVQHRPFRTPKGENINVAGHASSDAEATTEEQTDSDPASNVAMDAAAPDPIAAPDEPQIRENSDTRLELGGENRDILLSSSSDGSEVETGAESSVDEHRVCKRNH